MEADRKRKRHSGIQVDSPQLLTDRNQTLTFEAHAFMERGVAFHENSSNRSRCKEEKTLGFLSKVP
jgi:hypothetical protein